MESAKASLESRAIAERRATIVAMKERLWAEARVNRAILEHFVSIQEILRSRVARCDKMLESIDSLSMPATGVEVEESNVPW